MTLLTLTHTYISSPLPHTQGPALFYVDSDGSRLKGDVFSVGSGSTFAYGVLDQGYRWDLTDDEAMELGRRSIYAATRRDAYSGNVSATCFYRIVSLCVVLSLTHHDYYLAPLSSRSICTQSSKMAGSTTVISKFRIFTTMGQQVQLQRVPSQVKDTDTISGRRVCLLLMPMSHKHRHRHRRKQVPLEVEGQPSVSCATRMYTFVSEKYC